MLKNLQEKQEEMKQRMLQQQKEAQENSPQAIAKKALLSSMSSLTSPFDVCSCGHARNLHFEGAKCLHKAEDRNLACKCLQFDFKESRPACSNCKRRVCRKGTALCSRCTIGNVELGLRDTLPGLPTNDASNNLSSTNNSDIVSLDTSTSNSIGAETRETNSGVSENPRTSGEDQWTKSTSMAEDSSFVSAGQLNLPSFPANTKYYSRKQVSQIIGVSVTSIHRWEAKGKTPQPLQAARGGPKLYTEEHLALLKDFATRIEQVIYTAPQPGTPASQQSAVVKGIKRKVFKLNKSVERAVAVRIGKGGLLGGGKLI